MQAEEALVSAQQTAPETAGITVFGDLLLNLGGGALPVGDLAAGLLESGGDRERCGLPTGSDQGLDGELHT